MKELIRSKQKKQGTVKLAGALGLLLALSLIFGLVAAPAMAVPQLPNRFFGEVKIQPCDIFAPEDAQVSAEIYDPGLGQWVEYTSTLVVLVDDIAWYDFNVPADDLSTPEKEGGNAGDEVRFYVEGILAGTWDSFEYGNSDRLDLEVTDDVDPSVTITELTPDPTNVNTPTFIGTATDELTNIASVEYKVDDGEWTAADAVDGAFDSKSEDYTFTTAELDDEVHMVYVRATDVATNTTAEADYDSDEFTVDTAVPTFVSVAVSDPDEFYKAGDTISFDVDLGEAGLTVTADLTVLDTALPAAFALSDDGDGTYSGTSGALASGTMVEGVDTAVTLTATDAAGNPATDSSLTLTIATITFTWQLKAGWNMVSLPVNPGTTNPAEIFSDVSSYYLYTWDATNKKFVIPSELVAGKGYWILVFEDVTQIIDGTAIDEYSLEGNAGWHMIGSLSVEAQVEVSSGEVFSEFYTWDAIDKKFVLSTNLEPRRGYWLLAFTDFSITVIPKP